MKQTRGNIFHGWWVVLAAGIGLLSAPILPVTFGVFLKPLSQEFGWSRTQISLAFSLSTLALTGAVPLVGRLVDQWGARKVIMPAVVLFGLGVFSLAFLTAHLWHFYAVYFFLGVVSSGKGPVPYTKVLTRWFDRKRGLTLGVALAGISLGAFIMPPLAQALITGVGWHRAYMVLGLLAMVITLPIVGVLLTESPQAMGLRPDGTTGPQARAAARQGQEPGLSGREAWHTGTFWLLVGAFFLLAVSFHGQLIHLVPLLTDRGVSAPRAALAVSVGAVGSLLGRLGTGYLLDRFFAPTVAIWFFCAAAFGSFLLWSGVAGGGAMVAVVSMGLAQGAEFDLMAYTVSRYFGLRAFAEIYSYTFAAFTLGGVIGPLVMGASFDATGSYSLVLGGFVVSALTAAGLMSRLGPYQVWEADAEPVVATGVSRA
jgi:MFS family permease